MSHKATIIDMYDGEPLGSVSCDCSLGLPHDWKQGTPDPRQTSDSGAAS